MDAKRTRAGIVVGIVVWVFHSIDTYGWSVWREMIRRAKVAIHIRYLEFQNT